MTKPSCKLALAQVNPRLGDVAANLEMHEEWMQKAKGEGAELVVFPELALTGYRLRDLVFEVALRQGAPELERLAAMTKNGPDLVTGFVEESRSHAFYNSAAWFSGGELVHTHRKVYLPTYGLFEEGRFLASGSSFDAFDTRLGRVGILLCEDAWHLSAAYAYFLQEVDHLLVLSSGPGRGLPLEGEAPSSGKTWNSLLTAASKFFNCYSVYVNRVGYEDGVKFWGGSKVIDPAGEIVTEAGQVDAELGLAKLKADVIRLARIETPIRRDERPEILERLFERLRRGEA